MFIGEVDGECTTDYVSGILHFWSPQPLVQSFQIFFFRDLSRVFSDHELGER
jgi:hypothetical protein